MMKTIVMLIVDTSLATGVNSVHLTDLFCSIIGPDDDYYDDYDEDDYDCGDDDGDDDYCDDYDYDGD